MVMYTLTFSHKVNGQRQPLFIDGREATLTVEAESKSAAIQHKDTVAFCEQHNATVRMVRKCPQQET